MKQTEHKPELIVIAGPNGSGKTSVTKMFIKFIFDGADRFPNCRPKGFCHGFRYICIGFKAAGAQIRADGGLDIGRIAAEIRHHGLYGFAGNVSGCATPPGVTSAYSAAYGIVKQNGSAVGGEYHQGCAGGIGNEGITNGGCPLDHVLSPIFPAHGNDAVGMDLLCKHQLHGVKTKGFT